MEIHRTESVALSYAESSVGTHRIAPPPGYDFDPVSGKERLVLVDIPEDEGALFYDPSLTRGQNRRIEAVIRKKIEEVREDLLAEFRARKKHMSDVSIVDPNYHSIRLKTMFRSQLRQRLNIKQIRDSVLKKNSKSNLPSSVVSEANIVELPPLPDTKLPKERGTNKKRSASVSTDVLDMEVDNTNQKTTPRKAEHNAEPATLRIHTLKKMNSEVALLSAVANQPTGAASPTVTPATPLDKGRKSSLSSDPTTPHRSPIMAAKPLRSQASMRSLLSRALPAEALNPAAIESSDSFFTTDESESETVPKERSVSVIGQVLPKVPELENTREIKNAKTVKALDKLIESIHKKRAKSGSFGQDWADMRVDEYREGDEDVPIPEDVYNRIVLHDPLLSAHTNLILDPNLASLPERPIIPPPAKQLSAPDVAVKKPRPRRRHLNAIKKDTDILDEYPALPGLQELTPEEKKEQIIDKKQFTTQTVKDNMEFRTISTKLESQEQAVIADFQRKSPIPIDEEEEKRLTSQKMQIETAQRGYPLLMDLLDTIIDLDLRPYLKPDIGNYSIDPAPSLGTKNKVKRVGDLVKDLLNLAKTTKNDGSTLTVPNAGYSLRRSPSSRARTRSRRKKSDLLKSPSNESDVEDSFLPSEDDELSVDSDEEFYDDEMTGALRIPGTLAPPTVFNTRSRSRQATKSPLQPPITSSRSHPEGMKTPRLPRPSASFDGLIPQVFTTEADDPREGHMTRDSSNLSAVSNSDAEAPESVHSGGNTHTLPNKKRYVDEKGSTEPTRLQKLNQIIPVLNVDTVTTPTSGNRSDESPRQAEQVVDANDVPKAQNKTQTDSSASVKSSEPSTTVSARATSVKNGEAKQKRSDIMKDGQEEQTKQPARHKPEAQSSVNIPESVKSIGAKSNLASVPQSERQSSAKPVNNRDAERKEAVSDAVRIIMSPSEDSGLNSGSARIIRDEAQAEQVSVDKKPPKSGANQRRDILEYNGQEPPLSAINSRHGKKKKKDNSQSQDSGGFNLTYESKGSANVTREEPNSLRLQGLLSILDATLTKLECGYFQKEPILRKYHDMLLQLPIVTKAVSVWVQCQEMIEKRETTIQLIKNTEKYSTDPRKQNTTKNDDTLINEQRANFINLQLMTHDVVILMNYLRDTYGDRVIYRDELYEDKMRSDFHDLAEVSIKYNIPEGDYSALPRTLQPKWETSYKEVRRMIEFQDSDEKLSNALGILSHSLGGLFKIGGNEKKSGIKTLLPQSIEQNAVDLRSLRYRQSKEKPRPWANDTNPSDSPRRLKSTYINPPPLLRSDTEASRIHKAGLKQPQPQPQPPPMNPNTNTEPTTATPIGQSSSRNADKKRAKAAKDKSPPSSSRTDQSKAEPPNTETHLPKLFSKGKLKPERSGALTSRTPSSAHLPVEKQGMASRSLPHLPSIAKHMSAVQSENGSGQDNTTNHHNQHPSESNDTPRGVRLPNIHETNGPAVRVSQSPGSRTNSRANVGSRGTDRGADSPLGGPIHSLSSLAIATPPSREKAQRGGN